MTKRSILITGCSTGIGYDAAKYLQEKGYQVFAGVRQEKDFAALQSENLTPILIDMNNSHSIEKAVESLFTQTGGNLYGLFNNAGYLQAGAVEDLSRDAIRRQFETNVFGPMELCRLVLPAMRKKNEGRIIQNSSILGLVTIPYCGAYNASKHALEGFSSTLRQELYSTNIHVSIINPGPIRSQLRNTALKYYQEDREQFMHSAHREAYAGLEKHYFARKHEDYFVKGPEAVINKLIHALESARPHAHYYVGLPAHALGFLRRILPDSALDWILAKAR